MAQMGSSSSNGSGSSTSWLYIFRLVILILCSILSVADLGLISLWLTGSIEDDVIYSFEIVGIISGALTTTLIPAMLIVARIRRNAWFVYILTEVVVFGLLWILWTVTAALAIQDFNDFYLGSCNFLFPITRGWCNELSAIKGLSVTIFVLLLFYVLTLVIYAVVRTFTVGSGVWFQSVQEQRISAGSGRTAPSAESTSPGTPSMWDEKPSNEMRSEIAAGPVGGALPGLALQGSPAPSSAGVATYPPSALSQALPMQMGVASSAGATGPNLGAVGSSMTSLPAGAGVGLGAGSAQQYYSPAPQQVNMHVSRSSPQQQGAGLQTVGYQGAPVTPSYPQV